MVPITEEERNSPLYKYYIRDMVAPDPSRYEEVKMCIRDSSPVVPHAVMASVPRSSWQSISRASLS